MEETTADHPVLGRIGLGLWTMRSMAREPRHRAAAYRDFAQDAALAERLGFHSIWTAEHRIWYDGWCPAPLHALALAAGATTRLRLGTAVLLASQHDPSALTRAAGELHRISTGRLDLGLGLGHRDVEFDALGLRRDRRGRRMDETLAAMDAAWGPSGGPPVWIGGMAPRALERAAAGNHSLLLPQTLAPEEIRRCLDTLRAAGPWTGRVGVLRDVWIEPDPDRARALRAAFLSTFLEEAGWWILKGQPAFRAPEALDRQMARIGASALIGPPDVVAAGLRELLGAGAEFLCLRINLDAGSPSELREQMHTVAEALPPRLADLLAPVGATT